MNQSLKDAICVRCKVAFGDSNAVANEIVCSGCGQRYPVIEKRIPILVADPQKYLAEIYVQYKRFLRREQNNLTKLSEQNQENETRSAAVDSVQVAMRSNARNLQRIVEAIQEEVNQHVSVEDILDAVDGHPTVGYSTMLDYLLRDWCWLPEGEAELEVVRAALLSGINAASAGTGTALVVGAGTGRTAWDLCDVYERVWAIDNSFTMAHHFYSLLSDGTVPFYELNSRNIFDRADSTTLHRATLSSPRGDNNGRRDNNELSYFVADALNVPAPDGAFSAIFSVYFTDVVPLELYIREITRLLKTGGVFVHFGPLEYHFDNANHLLAADEVRSLFARHGFEVRFEDRARCTHLSSGRSMVSKVYDNWVFAAIKKDVETHSAVAELTHDSVLAIAGNVHYEVNGSFSAVAEEAWEATIVCPTRERFAGAGSVLSILRLVNGSRTVGQIVDLLGREYDVKTDASREAIVLAMGKLQKHGALMVVER